MKGDLASHNTGAVGVGAFKQPLGQFHTQRSHRRMNQWRKLPQWQSNVKLWYTQMQVRFQGAAPA
jgi:hypothetical protein